MLHDIGNPVSALGTSIDNFRQARTMGNEDASRLAASHLVQSYTTVNMLTSELFDLASFELKAQAVEIEVIRARDVMENIALAFHERATKKGIELRIAKTKDFYCKSDDVALHRIIMNLVSNAIKFTPARENGASGVVIGASERYGYVQLNIWDTGIGIPSARQQEIWEYGKTTYGTYKEKGYGIGLPLVLAICKSLPDHELGFSSTDGRGSRFWVRVPMASAIEAKTAAIFDCEPDIIAAERIRGLEVLVVDDELQVLNSERLLVQLLGASTTGASGLQEVLAEKEKYGRKPDLILTDFHLKDGEKGSHVIEETRRLWADEIPAIIITNDKSTACVAAIQAIPRVALMRKPLQKEAFVISVNRLLSCPNEAPSTSIPFLLT